MTDPVIALVAAIFGGVGLRVVESLLGRSKVKNDLETQMRVELRSDVMSLKEELEKIEEALDLWKKKYYDLLVSFNEIVLIARANGFSEDIEDIRRSVEGN